MRRSRIPEHSRDRPDRSWKSRHGESNSRSHRVRSCWMICRSLRETPDRRVPESRSHGSCMGRWLALRACRAHRAPIGSGLAARAVRNRQRLAGRLTRVRRSSGRNWEGQSLRSGFLEDSLQRANLAITATALCHGAWTDYDSMSGYATLRYWPRKQWREQGDRPISRHDLARIRRAAVEVTILVVDAITTRGIQFPGSDSPGRAVLPDQET